MDPAFPFGRWAVVPRQAPQPRIQCARCAGGGDINGVTCRDCDGRGYTEGQ